MGRCRESDRDIPNDYNSVAFVHINLYIYMYIYLLRYVRVCQCMSVKFSLLLIMIILPAVIASLHKPFYTLSIRLKSFFKYTANI